MHQVSFDTTHTSGSGALGKTKTRRCRARGGSREGVGDGEKWWAARFAQFPQRRPWGQNCQPGEAGTNKYLVRSLLTLIRSLLTLQRRLGLLVVSKRDLLVSKETY